MPYGGIGDFEIGVSGIGGGKTLDYYLSRIPPLNASKPNFIAVMSAVLQPFVDQNNFLLSLPAAFDVDFAIGVQLDVCGQWAGISRVIPIPIISPWFAWDDPIRCWDRSTWYVPGVTAGYTMTQLDDDDYRRLIYAKIAANSWDGTTTSAQTILTNFLNSPSTNLFVEDKGNRTAVICVAGVLPSIVDIEIIGQGLIPLKPNGVAMEVAFTSINGTPLFGFDATNENIAGWDAGSWGVSADYAAQNLT